MRLAVFTGTRQGHHPDIERLLVALKRSHGNELTVFVGDCETGVDAEVRRSCRVRGIDCAVFVANWTFHGNSAGPRRNTAIMHTAHTLEIAGAEVIVYYRASSERSPGTRNAVRQARHIGLECCRIEAMGPKL